MNELHMNTLITYRYVYACYTTNYSLTNNLLYSTNQSQLIQSTHITHVLPLCHMHVAFVAWEAV